MMVDDSGREVIVVLVMVGIVVWRMIMLCDGDDGYGVYNGGIMVVVMAVVVVAIGSYVVIMVWW